MFKLIHKTNGYKDNLRFQFKKKRQIGRKINTNQMNRGINTEILTKTCEIQKTIQPHFLFLIILTSWESE